MVHRLLVPVQAVASHRQRLEAVALRTFEVVGVAPHRPTLEVEEVLHKRREAEEVLPRILVVVAEVQLSLQRALRRRKWFSLHWN
jgi:hypothetical protein